MKVMCRQKKSLILSFPSQFTLEAAVGWGRVEKACCILSVLAGCLLRCFLYVSNRMKMSYIINYSVCMHWYLGDICD